MGPAVDRHEIAARYSEWEIVGPPEIRNVDPDPRYFTPQAGAVRDIAEIKRQLREAGLFKDPQ